MKPNHSYQTKNKKRIWEFAVSQKDAHFNANEVFRFFIMSGSPISMPTIYRQLDRMTAEGILQKYRTGESDMAFYFYVGEKRDSCERPLMKCTSCGKTFPLKCHTTEKMAEHIWDKHHFYVELETTMFYGKCARCMASRQE